MKADFDFMHCQNKINEKTYEKLYFATTLFKKNRTLY